MASQHNDDEGAWQATAEFVPLSHTCALLGESPVWSAAHQAVWWVDITGQTLMRTTLAGVTTCWDTPEIPGFIQCVGEKIYVGMQSGVFDFDVASCQFKKTANLDLSGQRFNDACTDDNGRIWAGTMDIDNKRDTGVLYLFDPERQSLVPKLDGFRTVNGLAWDAANSRLFVSDSHPSVQTVWTCQIDPNGQIEDRRVFAKFHDLEGRPDGAALDRAGDYWIAGVGGGRLFRFSTNGTLIACYRVPPGSPTKPAFTDGSDPSMVLTSFRDESDGGRLMIWHDLPFHT